MGQKRDRRTTFMRLHIITEGHGEALFVNKVLVPHLANFGVYADSRCITTSRSKREDIKYRGGFLKYSHLRNDLDKWIREEKNNQDIRFTTMLDLYKFRIPEENNDTFIVASKQRNALKKVEAYEMAMKEDIKDWRFIPYIQLHEFEALVLVEPQKLLTEFIGKKKKVQALIEDIAGLEPEEINETPENAPSKRIEKFFPEYGGKKSKTVGALIAEEIGIEKLKSRCPHFGQWIKTLEQLENQTASNL